MAGPPPERRRLADETDVDPTTGDRLRPTSAAASTPGGPPPTRRDQASRWVAIAILAAIIVPMLWLIISTAITGYGNDEPDRFPVVTRPTP